jgi:hypothetical protein
MNVGSPSSTQLRTPGFGISDFVFLFFAILVDLGFQASEF